MSFSWLLLILLLQNDPISSSFNGRLATRPILNRWSRSPESCGINWPLRRRHFPCFSRMSLNDFVRLNQLTREEYDRLIETFPTGTPPPAAGRVKPSFRMVGGNDSLRGEFPWSTSVELSINNQWIRHCNGAFLLSDWVLTAGHCVYSGDDQLWPPERFRIRYNADARRYADLNATLVQKYFVHPSFNYPEGPDRNEFDLALLRLVHNVSFERIHRPEEPVDRQHYYGANAICLPEVSWSVGSGNEDVYWFSSYGPYTYQRDYPEVLQKQMVVPKEILNSISNRYVLKTESRIGYAGCAGDSGSPMVVHNSDDRFFIAGVVRGGREWNSTARCGYIYMYLCQVTRDDPLNWIKETIANETGW